MHTDVAIFQCLNAFCTFDKTYLNSLQAGAETIITAGTELKLKNKKDQFKRLS